MTSRCTFQAQPECWPYSGASGKGGCAAENGGAKKDKEDFDSAVLHNMAGWPRMLRLHKYMPNFEG
ncbi:hypothetical protein BJY52DRAFT_1303805 [Lactarius psammicola]|nr:hypothetical protein BJY52DRAFT_1303805 [Lactarius psammicola]